MNSISFHNELLLSRVSFEMQNAIKYGGHDAFRNVLPHHRTNAKDGHRSHVRLFSNKEAAVRDFALFKWFRDRIEKRRINKNTRVATDVIKNQGKLNKTITFTYTNLSGVKSKREVDPYEIKNGYLWALDRGKRKHIKKFFLSKMENTRPGKNTFKPLWEVKLATDKIAGFKTLLRQPGIARGIEIGIGGLVGGGVGLISSAGEEHTHDKIEPVVKGVVAGSVGALILSKTKRKAIMKAISSKRQLKMWTRKKYDATGNLLQPDYVPQMKAVRKEYGKITSPKLFRKNYRGEFNDLTNRSTLEAKDIIRKKVAPGLIVKNEIAAFDNGFLASGKPRKMTAEVARAFAQGQTARGLFLSKGTTSNLHRETKKLIKARQEELKGFIDYDNAPMINRVARMIKKRPFGKI